MIFTLLYWGGPKLDFRLFHSASFLRRTLRKVRGMAGELFVGQFLIKMRSDSQNSVGISP